MEFFGFNTGTYFVLLGIVLPTMIYLYKIFTKDDNFWKEKGITYEPRVAWYIVLKAFLTKGIHEMELDKYKAFGRFYGGFEGRRPVLTVAEPDLLRDILVKDFHSFNNRRVFEFNDPVINNMVSILNDEQWKRVRSIMTPAFTSGKMRKMTNIVNDCSKAVVKNFISSAEQGTPADCKKIFGAFTMDVIASSAFATKIDSHSNPNNPFVVHARNSFSQDELYKTMLFFLLPSFLWKLFNIKLFDQNAVNFFRNVTLQVIEERRKKGIKGNDFLQLMMDANAEQCEADSKVDGYRMLDLEDNEKDNYGHGEENHHIFKTIYENKKMTHDELLAQCILFFMVGYETTGSTLSFAAYSLATNLDCQEKLIEEIDKVTKEKGELTYDSIKEMKYLDCVISETLRMYPPLIRAERTSTEEYKLGDTGITLPKALLIGFPIYAMHYDAEFFPEPEKFKPERFFPENFSHPSYAYLPFGAGPRNCLGMRFALLEIKLCLANVLKCLKFKTCQETKIPLEYALASGFLTPKGLVLTVEKR